MGELMSAAGLRCFCIRWVTFAFLFLSSASVCADTNIQAVYKQQVDMPLSAVYDSLYKSLENARFFVVFEPNIGKNLERFSDKWGG
jgi:hypothetical protein